MNKDRLRGVLRAGVTPGVMGAIGQRDGAGAGEDATAATAREVMSELTVAFADFRQRNDTRVDELTTMVNTQQETLAALRIGAGAGGDIVAGAVGFSSAVAEEFRNQLRGAPSAGMTTQSDPDGGYTVPTQVDRAIDHIMREISPMRRLARVVSLTEGKSWQKIYGAQGSQSGWVGEEEERPETNTPKLRAVEITPGEVYACPQLTNQLLDDSNFDIAGFVREDVSQEFALVEGNAFIWGDGMKKPRGLLTYPVATTGDDTRLMGTLQYVASGNASAFITPTATASPADCLHDLLSSLLPSYRQGAGVAWSMNSATANLVRKFKDGQGNFLWTNSIIEGQPDRLLGYAVNLDEEMPDVAANAFPIAFGNWMRGYAVVDKLGTRLLVDPYTQKGWTKFYMTKRVGGGLTDSAAIKLLKIATS